MSLAFKIVQIDHQIMTKTACESRGLHAVQGRGGASFQPVTETVSGFAIRL
jgi:hypothetical protein